MSDWSITNVEWGVEEIWWLWRSKLRVAGY